MNQCLYCTEKCVKVGKQQNGTQKFRCKCCKKYQLGIYRYKACHPEIDNSIKILVMESVGMRGIARILKISLTTVLWRIKKISERIAKPITNLTGKVTEMDELWTFVGKKTNEAWIMYALDRTTKEVIDFAVGSRTKRMISKVTDQLVIGNVRKVYTDGLSLYKSLVPEQLHRTGPYNTQRIERFNLNLRTHLKRLSRKTICFSKSKEMLEACLKIYFWGGSSMAI